MAHISSSFMAHALTQAQLAEAKGEVPVGALIVREGQIVATAHNEILLRADVTAHAEMLVLQRASQALGDRYLEKCDLYVTLEPCPMCAQAISLARIRRLYFGAFDVKGGAVDHGPRLYNQSTCFHRPEVYGGIMEQACSELLSAFFTALRS